MKIVFSVMKMEITTEVIIDEPFEIDKVKEAIFEEFWKQNEPRSPIGKHGDPSSVILMDRCQKINSTNELMERISKTRSFDAVFDKHLGEISMPGITLKV